MKKKDITAIIRISATVVVGAVAYMVAKKKKQLISGEGNSPSHKHSHIRRVRHAHEPGFIS